jgi:SAM-dependent methyltransferase
MSASHQQSAWEREYKTQQLLSPSNVPHADVMRFVRWLKKEKKREGMRLDLDGMRVLDLGSGTGRNAYYFAEQGAKAIGYEFSSTALEMAKSTAKSGGLDIAYRLQDIGKPFPLGDRSIDIALDVTSSNSLSDQGRAIYLQELYRALAPGGYLFLRTLSLEGDAHAKELIKRYPGPDPDTYVHPDLHIVEKTFSRDSLQDTYGPYFTFRQLDRVQHYATVAGRTYKRNYWVCYLQKPED